MTTEVVHLGDIGTTFYVTIMEDGAALDISTATVKRLIFQKRDMSTITKEAVFVTDGSDGKLKYVSLANDINMTGEWRIQGYVELPTGKWFSEIGTFMVAGNLA